MMGMTAYRTTTEHDVVYKLKKLWSGLLKDSSMPNGGGALSASNSDTTRQSTHTRRLVFREACLRDQQGEQRMHEYIYIYTNLQAIAVET